MRVDGEVEDIVGEEEVDGDDRSDEKENWETGS